MKTDIEIIGKSLKHYFPLPFL